MRRGNLRFVRACALVCAVAFLLVGIGCGDDGECLVYGENCTLQYKRDNYGTEDIGCCEGSCTTSLNNNLICR